MNKIIFVSCEMSVENQQSQKVLKRFDQYAKALDSSSNSDKKIMVFVKEKKSLDFSRYIQNFPNLQIIPLLDRYFFSGRLFFQLTRYCIEHSRSSILLIAGDPWVDSCIVSLLKKLLWWIPIKTQMSVHGDLINQEKSLFKRWVKKIVLVILLNNSDTIRVVSEHLGKAIVDELHVESSKIFVSPIPVTLPKLSDSVGGSKKYIAFIGRLHPERGLSEYLTLIKYLKGVSADFKYLIAGDGPDRTSFLGEIARIVGKENVVYRGLLSDEEMANVWKDCKILLSTAPAEGYGLAIRESILNGTFVIARENSGTQEARKEFKYGLHIYKNVDQAVALVSNLMQETFSFSSMEQARNLVNKSNEESINNLINSWR